MADKARVLLIGSGGVGTIAALNLEVGDGATVDAVLRSNFKVVNEKGFTITSVDHGKLFGWRPSKVLNSIPNVAQDKLEPYDFVVISSKNIPDVPPTVVDLASPAITPGRTVVVLIQNGLNIEKPFFEKFPQNVVLSGVSIIGSQETESGVIEQNGHDSITIGPFANPNLGPEVQEEAGRRFVALYSAAGKCTCTFDDKVAWSRWRKLIYNSCLNPICAITQLDSGRIRLADDAVATLVRPAMEEIKAVAAAAGHILPEDIVDFMIELDPLQIYFPPSMQQDLARGSYIEHENIVGEPVRVGKELGVPTPTLSVIYSLCKAIQWRNKQAKGLIEIPPMKV